MIKNVGLLWIDCIGGLLAGVLVLAACRWLAEWHRLPLELLVFMGLANLAYGCCSLLLASRRKRPLALIGALALANMAWGVVCLLMISAYWSAISWLGLFHLGGEGAYVASLGMIEWRYRRSLGILPGT